MAYKKLAKSLNLPVATEQSVGVPPEEELGRLKRFCASLVAAMTPFMADVISTINDLVGGNLSILILQKQTTAPIAPSSGTIAYADGTAWNPGSGEGVYAYYGGTWNKL